MRATSVVIVTATLALAGVAHADPDKRKSRADLEACAAAFGTGAADEAIARCDAAVAEWPGNHRAWYVLGLVQTSRDWRAAAAALERAAQASPDEAMYRQWAGVAWFELADHAAARPHLERAVALNADLWRARFYLGQVHAAAGDDRLAAAAFTRAIAAHADLAPAYAALANLYRRWGYLGEAAQVATAGTKHVTDAAQRGELWFALGLGHVDAQNDDAAIEAFGHALADRPQDAQARVQRGVAYYRKGDLVRAKADVEAALAGELDAAARAAAEKILKEIARRKK